MAIMLAIAVSCSVVHCSTVEEPTGPRQDAAVAHPDGNHYGPSPPSPHASPTHQYFTVAPPPPPFAPHQRKA
ncbi:hypothetical protein HU200_060371 [Digitaria exilis]|uniref:Secreted protein n=1 Tax=Digitaria exilis TaxID=1010633 RepID=A0A835AGN4_9POAL|nr:hypothetical protein HU200_060371 [Digitaria exilis]